MGDEDEEGDDEDEDEERDEASAEGEEVREPAGQPAAASSSHSLPPPVTLDNCIRTLAHVKREEELRRELPDVSVNERWEIWHRLHPARLGKIRCIMGESLRVDCDVHKQGCKLHIDIRREFEWAQCQLVKWIAQGLSSTKDEHVCAASAVAGAWRSR